MHDIVSEMRLATLKASKAVLDIYRRGFETKTKSDSSPVTDADLASNRILKDRLGHFQGVGFLSEEEADDHSRLNYRQLFIVDPLDGTQDFVNHDDSFAINVALVDDRHPLIGFVAFPYHQTYCYAVRGMGSYYVDKEGKETRLHVSDRLDDLIYLSSKMHENQKEKDLVSFNQKKIREVIHAGASVKAYYLACGKGDASVRFTDMTKEWDVCAPELIVTEAGGIFLDTNLRPFEYNRMDVYNRDGYCMFNRKENEILLTAYEKK